MNEAAAKIIQLERRVMWRNRLLALQDAFATAITFGALATAGLVLLVRLGEARVPEWAIILGALSLSFAAALARWFPARATERDAAHLIDESLGLEDRVATSQSIIERGGAALPLEEALLEDAAERITGAQAASIVPFRMRRWYALALAALIGLTAALMIPHRSPAATEALAAERADIETAGDRLEQSASEVEQLVQPDTDTMSLAKEQAELGRVLRRSPVTRAEALKRLSALEEKIRRRHDDLAGTRANEIVSLAEQRLEQALPAHLTAKPGKRVPLENDPANRDEASAEALRQEPLKAGRRALRSLDHKPAGSAQPKREESSITRSERSPSDQNGRTGTRDTMPAQKPQSRTPETVSEKDPRVDSAKLPTDPAAETTRADEKNPGGQKRTELAGEAERAGEQRTPEQKAPGQEPGQQDAGALDALKAVPSSVAEQAAKALPKMSEELLKKAAELRAGQLSPGDIDKLRQAAESLSRDLAQIAESKDLRQALEQLARQVRPEQIEQVARELGGQEKLKQELEAAGRLLMENRQAKEMVAGLARQFAHLRDEIRPRPDENSGARRGSGQSRFGDERGEALTNGLASRDGSTEAPAAESRKHGARGTEASLRSRAQQAAREGAPGEYLYLQSKAGAGAARAPYSSAYPQYRRVAERSVGRSQVPPKMRSVVRKYFDAINPDARRPQ